MVSESDVIERGDIEYGCLFCRTGLEENVILRLQDVGIRAVGVKQIRHKSVKGVKSHTLKVLFPGYVFFEANRETEIQVLRYVPNVLRALSDGKDHWFLRGDNRKFAKWVMERDGLIEMSGGYREGDKVVFDSGPLKDYVGSVVKVDRRNRNGLVEIKFDNNVFRIWMAFEMVSPAK